MQSSCTVAILLGRSEENGQVFLPRELPLTVYFLYKPNRLVVWENPCLSGTNNHATFKSLTSPFFYILMLSSGLEKVILTIATCLNALHVHITVKT